MTVKYNLLFRAYRYLGEHLQQILREKKKSRVEKVDH